MHLPQSVFPFAWNPVHTYCTIHTCDYVLYYIHTCTRHGAAPSCDFVVIIQAQSLDVSLSLSTNKCLTVKLTDIDSSFVELVGIAGRTNPPGLGVKVKR